MIVSNAVLRRAYRRLYRSDPPALDSHDVALDPGARVNGELGCDYEVKHCSGRVVARGWSAGKRADGLEEALRALRRICEPLSEAA